MKRIILSIVGGVSITFLLAAIPYLLVEVLKIEWLEAVAEVVIMADVWPVIITRLVFPQPHDALLFDIQDTALRAALIIDVMVYSLITYVVLRWRAQRAPLP
ncbi:MAG: hypothetical protein LC754_04015 [Acidobacteria bacterium]|nr:hypothetical protein [Acidobacteriota bacterium]